MRNNVNIDEYVISLAQEMIRTVTVNPPGDERILAEHLERVMREGGLTTKLYPLSPQRASVVGRVQGTGARPALAMVGHIDTVAPGEVPWSFDPFCGDLADGKLLGRGAADMKGGTAAIVAAAIAVARTKVPLQGDLIVACTAGEEVDCVGAVDLLNQNVFKGVANMLIPEPSNLAVYHAEKGALWLKVVVHGKTAHGSMAHEGHNAIDQLTRLLEQIRKYPFEQTEHKNLGMPTVSIGTVSGGTKVNVVADRCEATVDMRTLPQEDHERIIEQVREMAVKLTPAGVPPPEVSALVDRPAVETAGDDLLVQTVAASVREITLEEGLVGTAPYFSDAAVLIPVLQIPMAICGPGRPEMAHQPDEYVQLDLMTKAVRIYMSVIEKLLA